MKKLILVFLSLSLFIALNIIFSNNHYYLAYLKEIQYKHDIFPSEDEKFQFVGIGNSHARDSLHLNQVGGINLGLSAQSIELNFMMLKKYENFFAENVTIFYELSYSSFLSVYTSSKRIYLDLGFSHTDLEISIEDYILSKYFPLIGIESTKFFLNYIYDKNPQHFADVLFDFENEESLILNSQNYYKSTYLNIKPLKEMENIISKNIDILVDTILWANSRSFKIIFYTAPHYKALAVELNNENEIIKSFNSIIRVLEENLEIHYINLNYIDDISSNFRYFRDANHLNNEGAIVFTNYLLSFLSYRLNND
jgi:hypothetical protein